MPVDFTGWKIRKIGDDVGSGCNKNCRKVMLCTLLNDPSKLCPKHKAKHNLKSSFIKKIPNLKSNTEYKESFKKWPAQQVRTSYKPGPTELAPSPEQDDVIYPEISDEQYICRPIVSKNVPKGEPPEDLPDVYPITGDFKGPCKGYPSRGMRKEEDTEEYVFPCAKVEADRKKPPTGPGQTTVYTNDYQAREPFRTESFKPNPGIRQQLIGKDGQPTEYMCYKLDGYRPAEFVRPDGRKLMGKSLYKTEFPPWPVHPRTVPKWIKHREACKMTTCPRAPFDSVSVYQDSFKPWKRTLPPMLAHQKSMLSERPLGDDGPFPSSTYETDYKPFCVDATRTKPPRHAGRATEFCKMPIEKDTLYKSSYKGERGIPAQSTKPLMCLDKSPLNRPTMGGPTEYNLNYVPYSNAFKKAECPLCNDMYCIPACICPPDEQVEEEEKKQDEKIPLQSIRLPPIKQGVEEHQKVKLENCEVVVEHEPVYKIYC